MARQAVSATTDDGGEELTRGHKKKARTRQLLIEAALRIYARKGTGELALNELAEEAGVSNGTVYNYFRTRDDVLTAVGLDLADQLSHRVAAVSLGVTNGAERLAIGVRTFLLRTQEDPDWARALLGVVHYGEGMRTALSAYVRGDLDIGRLQGDFHYGSEDMALALVIGTTMAAITAVVEGRQLPQVDSIVAEMILLGLGLPAREAARIARLPMPLPAS